MLMVPGVNDRMRLIVEDTLPGGDYEDSTAGGVMVALDTDHMDETLVIEYEYTRGTWFAVIYACRVESILDFTYNVDAGVEAIETGNMERLVVLMNEYQAGAMDGIGHLRGLDDLHEAATVIWSGELAHDYTQLAVETMLVATLRELVAVR